MPKTNKQMLGDSWKAQNKTTEMQRLSTILSGVVASTDFIQTRDKLKRMSYIINMKTAFPLCYSDTARRLTADIFKEKYNLYTKFIFSYSKRNRHEGSVRRYYTIEISPLPFK